MKSIDCSIGLKLNHHYMNKLNDKFMFRCNFEWHDLLQEFRKIPFAQEGVFDFNLKNVAKMMKKKGLIKTFWNKFCNRWLGSINCNYKRIKKIRKYS